MTRLTLASAGAGVLAALVAVLLLDPLGAATIDPDATASVLYFQHIVSLRHLASFVPTTPKPLLTVVYGVTWTLGHDWRWLVLETIAVFGVAVASGAALAGRVVAAVAARDRDAGGRALASPFGRLTWRATLRTPAATLGALAAAGFLCIALLCSSDMLLEVSRANSLVWALAAWFVAGLAATARPARPWITGVALLVAGLCRFETLAIDVAALLLVLLLSALRGRGPKGSGRALARRWSGPLLLGLCAFPAAMAHDVLLTGDPFYFLTIPARYTAVYNPDLQPTPALTYAATLVGDYVPSRWLLVGLALIGVAGMAIVSARRSDRVAALARERSSRVVPVLCGVVALAGGQAVLLLRLATGGTYISNRYREPIDLALVVAAAVGTGWLVALVLDALAPGLDDRPGPAPAFEVRAEGDDLLAGVQFGVRAELASARPSSRRYMATGAVLVAIAAVVGGFVSWPALPFDRRASTELADVRASSAHLSRALPYVAAALAAGGGSSGEAPPVGVPYVNSRAVIVFAPSRDVSRIVVEAGVPSPLVGDLYAFLLHHSVGELRSSQYVLHDRAADRPVGRYTALEIGPAARAVDGVTLAPVVELNDGGGPTVTWFLEVR